MTDLLWSQALPYIRVSASIFALFTLIISLHIIYMDTDSVNSILVLLLIFFDAAGGLYNVFEIILERTDYLKDLWNIIDISANALTAIYLVLYGTDSYPDDRKVILAFANFSCWLRLVGYFRIFEPTRYLIRMIQEIL